MLRGAGALASILAGAGSQERARVSGKAADLLVSNPTSTTVGIVGVLAVDAIAGVR